MCAAIETPGKCEIRAVIQFLQAEGHSAAEIHRRMSAVHGLNFMSDKCHKEWCKKFRDGRTDVHDEGGQGRPSLVTDNLVQHDDKVCVCVCVRAYVGVGVWVGVCVYVCV